MLDAEGLGRLIGEHYRRPGDRLFRLETLPAYSVDADGDDYERWLNGEPEPTWARKQPWLDTLRRNRDNGMLARRVRILSARLTDYERYESEFGYAYNTQAGEDIRVLRRGEHDIPPGLLEHDFWLINDDIAVAMDYDDSGRFEGAELADARQLSRHLRTRDAAWAAAEPFPAWWSRHPELHRPAAA